LTIALTTAGAQVNIDYVFLQPGEWGRYAGLPVLRSTVDALLDMGTKVIRQGGSFASVGAGSAEYYQWQKWTGPPYLRNQSIGAKWKDNLIGGWGPFEMIDMCNAAGIEPVITTTESSTAGSFADLVEYCWGNSSTAQVAKRHADGHPAPYKVKYFELGNEQYNPNYVDQVAAMEAKATSLGLGGDLKYIFPNNGHFLSDDDLAKASHLQPRLDSQMLSDFHVGAGGALNAAAGLFASHPTFLQGGVNLETNAGTHHMTRAYEEAADLNAWFSEVELAPRLHVRTASFCTERAGHFDGWDQGISFFLPNMTWLQPPGYVHQMIARTWLPRAVSATATAGSVSAQRGEGALAASVVMRYVNSGGAPIEVTIVVKGVPIGPTATVWQLNASDPSLDNTPGEPHRISPNKFLWSGVTNGSKMVVPPYSFTVIEF